MTARLSPIAWILAFVVAGAQGPSRTFVVVFDDQHLSPGELKRMQAAAVTLFTREFKSGDLGGVVVDGRLVNDRLLADRAELLRAVERAHPRRDAPPPDNDARTLSQTAGVETSARLADAEAQEAARASTDRELAVLDSLIANLSRVDGRKSVLLLSEGFGGDGASPRVRDMTAAAMRAGVRFHVLDTDGTDRDAASGLARGTGGIIARNGNALAPAIAEIARTTISTATAGTTQTGASDLTAAASPSSAAVAVPLDAAAGATAPETASMAKGVVLPAASTDPGLLHVRPLADAHVIDLAGGDWSDASARAGWDAYQRGDLELARTALGPAAAQATAPSWVQYVLGQADYALGRFREASVAWERVRRRQPQFQPVYLDLADGYVKMNERSKALGVLREARRRWPHDVDVLSALGVTEAAGGALDDAIKVFAEATAVAPNETITYLNLGKSLEMRYFKLRRYLQAPRLWVTDERDREGALKNYEHYVAAGGPYAAQAREGIARLKAVDNRPIP